MPAIANANKMPSVSTFGGGISINFSWQLEDGFGFWALEDSINNLWLLEEAS